MNSYQTEVLISVETFLRSFGCIFYELVELERAFDVEGYFQIIKAIMEKPIPNIISEPNLNSILSK